MMTSPMPSMFENGSLMAEIFSSNNLILRVWYNEFEFYIVSLAWCGGYSAGKLH